MRYDEIKEIPIEEINSSTKIPVWAFHNDPYLIRQNDTEFAFNNILKYYEDKKVIIQKAGRHLQSIWVTAR